METDLPYLAATLKASYTLINLSILLLCLRFLLWPLSLRLAMLVWIYSTSGRYHFWQQTHVQKNIAHLTKEMPLAELIFSQRLGFELHQHLKPGFPALLLRSFEQNYPRAWAVVSPNGQFHLLQFGSNYLGQVVDDLLDQLRQINWQFWNLLPPKKIPIPLQQRLDNGKALLLPIESTFNYHLQFITWILLAVTLLLALRIPCTKVTILVYANVIWLALTGYAVWKVRKHLGEDKQVWRVWSRKLADDLSKNIYNVRTLFATTTERSVTPQKLSRHALKGQGTELWRMALTSALEYHWGSANFHGSIADQLLEKINICSQQTYFGIEQQVAIRNRLQQHLYQSSSTDQKQLLLQMTGSYWLILLGIAVLIACFFSIVTYAYF